MFRTGAILLAAGIFFCSPALAGEEAPLSPDTEECLACHESIHPGIVGDWRKSRHAAVTPAEALKEKGLEKKVSSKEIPPELLETAVGCAECHTARPGDHKGTFDHNGFEVHVDVSPGDCALCHATESEEFGQNLMAHARGNLIDNPVYADLQAAGSGMPQAGGKALSFDKPDEAVQEDSCIYCHGTRLEVKEMAPRETILGEMDFPVLAGWPNQGVGRVNTDGTKGACSACHPRHSFSMATARKPYTCQECHIGPDVPAYKVYSASKHGNLFASQEGGWNFTNTPWTPGRDFTAPTCAACHMSLLADTNGEVLSPRTHKVNDRLSWRLFGVPYAHAHPKNPDTSLIRNSHGLPLPTDLSGTPAAGFLIDKKEQEAREEVMRGPCMACHDASWVDGHFERFHKAIHETNQKTLVATKIMADIWKRGLAQGLPQEANPFDEPVERTWTTTWLFFANTIRFSSAMAGGGDYGSFANGRFQLNGAISELWEWRNDHAAKEKTP